jgi:hypothetical protein
VSAAPTFSASERALKVLDWVSMTHKEDVKDNAGEDTTLMGFDDEGTTLVDAELIVASLSRKRARDDLGDEKDDIRTAVRN